MPKQHQHQTLKRNCLLDKNKRISKHAS